MIATITKISLLLAFLFLSLSIFAQDIHLSHIHASPIVLNPSMVGLFDGEARVIANARSQWNTVTKGYKTMVASADMKLAPVNKSDFISGGLLVAADRAGDLNFTTTSVGLALSYLKGFDQRGRNMIAFGLQTNYVGSRVDYSKVRSFEAIHALQSNPNNQISYWDMSAGVSWYYRPNRHDLYYFGLSAHHLNNPDVSFLENDAPSQGSTLYRRLNFHAGASIRLSREMTIKPSVLFMDQGPHREITVGSFFRYRTNRRGLHRRPLYFVYVGAWVRSYLESDVRGMDAIVASLRFDYRKMKITFSYDINISSYTVASQGRGGLEASFIRIFDWDRSRPKRYKVKCPAL